LALVQALQSGSVGGEHSTEHSWIAQLILSPQHSPQASDIFASSTMQSVAHSTRFELVKHCMAQL
jgi:hypothetical protein